MRLDSKRRQGATASLLRQMQQKQEQIMQDLAHRKVEVSVGGGAIRLVMNGHQEVQELVIAPEVVDPGDVEMLQDLLIAAFNEGVARSREVTEESLRTLLEGLGLPGLRP